MIFITVGTDKFQFDRLLRGVDIAAGEGMIKDNVYAQVGSSLYEPKNFSFSKFMSFADLVKMIDKADIVVSHAGVASVLLSLKAGKVPVLFPRMAKYREVIDDHQIDFARKMEKMNRAIVAYSEKDLVYVINSYKGLVEKLRPAKLSQGKEELVEYLNTLCFGIS